jgi:aspartate/methionine/tyrosine aminotransferase
MIMAKMNPQAEDLNNVIAESNPNVMEMLAARGKAVFFPAKGILGQSAQAQGKKINATIGIALEDDGTPMRLGCIEKMIDLTPAEAFPYAPSYGNAGLRAVWRESMYAKNPDLKGVEVGNPVVTCALTHALSMCAYMFGDPGDKIYLPDLYWGNYGLLFANAYGMEISTYNTFKDGGYDVEAMREALLAGPIGKRIVLLNFPNNPTGYTVTPAEADRIREVLIEVAEAGNQVVAWIDDAYFGLVYEDGILTESTFGRLANAHERILAVKVDGATKEDYVWGFRVGFITYAIKGGTTALYKALEAKTAGAIRGNISNAPAISQSLMKKAYLSDEYAGQKKEKYNTLKARVDKVKKILAAHPEYRDAFEALPFNSGYFMCVRLKSAQPEAVRNILLEEFSTGVIAASGVVRLAFSATPFDLLEELFDNLYKAALKAG